MRRPAPECKFYSRVTIMQIYSVSNFATLLRSMLHARLQMLAAMKVCVVWTSATSKNSVRSSSADLLRRFPLSRSLYPYAQTSHKHGNWRLIRGLSTNDGRSRRTPPAHSPGFRATGNPFLKCVGVFSTPNYIEVHQAQIKPTSRAPIYALALVYCC